MCDAMQHEIVRRNGGHVGVRKKIASFTYRQQAIKTIKKYSTENATGSSLTKAEHFAAFCIRQNIWKFDGVESHSSFKRKGA